jgi:hypothetical protein
VLLRKRTLFVPIRARVFCDPYGLSRPKLMMSMSSSSALVRPGDP